MSSVAVMLHLVGTSLRFLPNVAVLSILLSQDSSIPCLCSVISASALSMSLSSWYFCTLVGTLGLLVILILLSSACGPSGVIMSLGLKLTLGFSLSATSMSTLFFAMATSCASPTSFSVFLMSLWNRLFTSCVLYPTMSAICLSFLAQYLGASYSHACSWCSIGLIMPTFTLGYPYCPMNGVGLLPENESILPMGLAVMIALFISASFSLYLTLFRIIYLLGFCSFIFSSLIILGSSSAVSLNCEHSFFSSQ